MRNIEHSEISLIEFDLLHVLRNRLISIWIKITK